MLFDTYSRNYFFFPHLLLSGYNVSSVTHFFWAMTGTMSQADEVRCSSSLRSHVVLLLLPLVSTLFFSQTGGVLPYSHFSTHKVFLVSTEKIVFPHHAHCFLYRLRSDRHRLPLNSYFSKIGRIKHLLCSACGRPIQDTSHLLD